MSKSIKLVYILIDGVSDSIGNNVSRTPLENAVTKNLDSLTKNGIMGEVIPIEKGIAPESDIAVFNMLGYNFSGSQYVGRGVVEALGAGIKFNDGDVALRGNFATLDNNNNIIDRRAGRTIEKKDTTEIAKCLEQKIKFSKPNTTLTVVPTVGHRVSINIKCKDKSLSGDVTNTDPSYNRINGIGVTNKTNGLLKIRECFPLNNKPSSTLTANLINEFTTQSKSIMKKNKINRIRKKENKKLLNCILLRDAGNKYPSVTTINKLYSLKFSCVVDMPVELGISKILKMKMYNTKSYDYEKKSKAVIKALETQNAVYVHLKGPDEFGHDGDFSGKTKSIEEIDDRFFKSLMNNIDTSKVTIVVSADHSTPCISRVHTDDPVPLLISSDLVKKDNTNRFTEMESKKGKLKLLKGYDVLTTVLNILNHK